MDNQIEWEQEFLGSLMLIEDPTSKPLLTAISKVESGCFLNSDHRKMLKAIKQIVQKGDQVNGLTISDNCDLPFHVPMSIAKNTVSAANLPAVTSNLVNASVQRFALSKMNEAMIIINDKSQGTLQDRMQKSNAVWSEVAARMQSRESRLKRMSEYMEISLNETYDRIEGLIPAGYKSPYENLNDLIDPKNIPQGSLFVVGGLPKMGKTKVVSGLTNGMIRMYDEQVIIYSLEMMGEQMAERAMCEDARVDSGAFWRKDGPEDHEAAKLGITIQEMRDKDIWVNDRSGITIEEIETECRQLARDKKVGMIAVDYLTLMTAPKADRNDLAFGMITKRLKTLAKELKCVVLLLTQLSREVAKRPDKRPMPADGRDTGQIEQDCDFWLAVHKQAVYEDDNYQHPDIVELILRLNRHGRTGTIYMKDMGAYLIPTDRPAGYNEQVQHKTKNNSGFGA